MKTRYSRTTGAFYPLDIDYPSLPADVQEVDYVDYQKAMARAPGETFDFDAAGVLTIHPAPIPTQDQVRTQYEAAAQDLLDSTARAWGYDSVISAASYASSGVAQYKADAQALINWRDALWQKAFSVESDVKAGTIPMPATSADFLAMLPAAPTRPTA